MSKALRIAMDDMPAMPPAVPVDARPAIPCRTEFQALLQCVARSDASRCRAEYARLKECLARYGLRW